MNVQSRLSTSNAGFVEVPGIPHMDEFIALELSVLSGVIVSLVNLWLPGDTTRRQPGFCGDAGAGRWRT